MPIPPHFPNRFVRRSSGPGLGWSELMLVLLGAALACWLLPEATEGPGF